jgi:hypothetical protein
MELASLTLGITVPQTLLATADEGIERIAAFFTRCTESMSRIHLTR